MSQDHPQPSSSPLTSGWSTLLGEESSSRPGGGAPKAEPNPTTLLGPPGLLLLLLPTECSLLLSSSELKLPRPGGACSKGLTKAMALLALARLPWA